MRRSAIKFALPALCAVFAVLLTDPIGKADERIPQPPPRVMIPQPQLKIARPAPVARLPLARRQELLHNLPKAHMVMMEVTAYCACKKCCGPKARGITASGKRVTHNDGKFVAADTTILPFNTKIIIPGYASNRPVEVLDR